MKEQRYIRTSEGYILDRNAEEHKIIIKELENENIHTTSKFGEIVKQKENQLDLIKIGDALKVESKGEITIVGFSDDYVGFYSELKNKAETGEIKILSIATKERFEEIEYILESEEKQC